MPLSDEEFQELGLQEFLKNPLVKAIKREAKNNMKRSHEAMQKEFLQAKWDSGGKEFVERIKQYGRTERDKPIIVDPHFEELLEALGDFRIARTLTTGCAQSGKEQHLDAKILTPTGWVRMGDIKVGDLVIARDGTPTPVIGVYPQGEKSSYRVTFDDGSSTECGEDHLWYTQVAMDRGRNYSPLSVPAKLPWTRQRDWEPTEYGDRPGSVKTLREIMDTLYQKDKHGNFKYSRGKLRSNHSIPLCKPVEFETKYFDVHPYLLGCLIGDGSLSADVVGFTTVDKEILDKIHHVLPDDIIIRQNPRNEQGFNFIKKTGLAKNPLKQSLIKIGIFGHKSETKFIPEEYKYGDIYQRLELLRGLMDTDGTVSKKGNVNFGSVSKKLVEDVRELIWSLGGRTGEINSKQGYYIKDGKRIDCQMFYRVSIKLPFNPFYISRKYDRWVKCNVKTFRRYIRSVELVDTKPSQCIAIAHPDHLYITDDYIVTHNTLSNMLLLVDTLVYGRCQTAFFFDSQVNMRNNVPIQFQPIVENYVRAIENAGLAKFNRSRDRTMLERYMVDLVTAFFAYTSVNKSAGAKASSGRAAVGGTSASFSADLLMCDEVSQYEAGAYDPLPRRIDASVIASKPQRLLGTQGAGGGIEKYIKEMEHNFYPHCECGTCGSIFPLDPKGCLLKPFERQDASGNTVMAYLTESGRPKIWFCHDEDDAINTAYIGCPECGDEIDAIARHSSRYRCLNTGVWLRDWLDSIPPGIPEKIYTAAFHITPLTRRTETNLAADLIRTGLNAVDARDYQQQALGHPSETIMNALTLQVLERSIKAPLPPRQPDVRLAGVDMGTNAFYMAIADFQMPLGWKDMPTEEVIASTIRQYLFLSEIPSNSVPQKLKDFHVSYGVMDQEPYRTKAAEFQRTTVLDLGDQISNYADAVKESEVEEGGNKIKCWKFRNEKFLFQLINSFLTCHPDDGFPLARLPDSFDRWISMPTDVSPLRHMLSIYYDPYTNKWGSRDPHNDLAYASMFMELSFYLYLTKQIKNSYVPGALTTVEKNNTPTFTNAYAGVGSPRNNRRSSFIPSRRFIGR
jgi:hypothetical protein